MPCHKKGPKEGDWGSLARIGSARASQLGVKHIKKWEPASKSNHFAQCFVCGEAKEKEKQRVSGKIGGTLNDTTQAISWRDEDSWAKTIRLPR